MRLHVTEHEFFILRNVDEEGSALRIDRVNGRATRITAKDRPADAAASAQFIYGVFGVINLLRGKYLVVITNAKQVASFEDHKIYKITETNIIPFSVAKVTSDLPSAAQRADEQEYLRLLGSVLESYSFYFSYTMDLTHSLQRIAEVRHGPNASLPLWKRADERFFWNRFLSNDFVTQNLDEFVLPVISGFVGAHAAVVKGRAFNFLLISRRGCKRAGRRYTSRGLDAQGNASNYAETEQIIVMPDPSAKKRWICSFVQTRGSIPLLWQQSVCIKYMPKPDIIGDQSQRDSAFAKHFHEQDRVYKGRQILVNLIDRKGKELILEQAFADAVQRAGNGNIRYVGFDFHKECKNMKYENLSKLEDTVKEEFLSMGWFSCEIADANPSAWRVLTEQKGTFRTNCMDCLDRTNVVQSVFAHKVLVAQLQEVGVLSPQELKLNSLTAPAFEQMYKDVWADNADAVALQYTGTGAMKTDYTRTGKRTKQGALQDLVHSVKRYLFNNFFDGDNQDALDLFLGLYVPEKVNVSPFSDTHSSSKQRNSLLQLLGLVAAVLLVLLVAWGWLGPAVGLPTPSVRLRFILVLLAYPVVAFKVAEKRGKHLVNRPRLRKDALVAVHGDQSTSKSKSH